MEINLKFYRSSPGNGSKGDFQEYPVEIDEGATVLDALMQVKEEQDSTIAFRGSCRSGFCGDCTMRISRRNRVACTTTVGAAQDEGTISVEPVRLISTTKDMMYDLDFWVYDKYKAVEPWIETDQKAPDKEHVVPNKVVQDLRKVMSCTMCWLCDEGCSTMVVDRNFAGPLALTKAYRTVFDPRDNRTEERLNNLSEKNGMWDCCHCYEASEHCPKEIDPTERIFALRNKAIKANAGIPTVRNHYRSFAKSVKNDGWLDEARLAIETEGLTNIKGQLKQVPLAIKAFRKGKRPLPYFLHEKREGRDRIKRIFDTWEEKD
jgi:succinate dehydrogenase / fumarate reductase iron-sulfur subunit